MPTSSKSASQKKNENQGKQRPSQMKGSEAKPARKEEDVKSTDSSPSADQQIAGAVKDQSDEEGWPETSKPTPYYWWEMRGLLFVLGGIFLILLLTCMYHARAVFFPILLAIILNFLLSPLVRMLGKFRIPCFASALLVLVGALGIVGLLVYQLADPASEWIRSMPDNMQTLEARFMPIKQSLEDLSRTSEQVMKATNGGETDPTEPVKVQVAEQSLSEKMLDFTGAITGELATALIMLYFLLAQGDRFLRKVVALVPSYQEKWHMVEIARDIERGISHYLFSITMINIGLGVAIALAMWMLDMPNPILWGTMATLFNFVPYIGAIVGIAVVGVVALLEFESTGYALLIPGTYFLLTALEGNFITPTLLGYRLDLNPLINFVWLVFWGWMWGVPGALVAIPMLAILKLICDHFKSLRPLGSFLIN